MGSGVGATALGAQAVGVGTTAPVPALPVFVGGQRGRVRYVIYDPVTGSRLIDDLPHLYQSKWDIVGFQPGTTGTSAIGTFEVKLPPPLSDEYKAGKAFLDLLDYGQRIEGYLGDVLAGRPRFAGVIRGITKSYKAFTISGDVSLTMLQVARSARNDVFSGSTDRLMKSSLQAYDVAFADDFSAGLGNFTNDGGWAVGTDPALPPSSNAAILPGSTGDGLLYTTSSFSNAQYADCSVEFAFRMVCPPGGQAETGIVAAATDANNLVLGQAVLRYIDGTHYALDFYLYQKVGGVYGTPKAVVQSAFVIPNNVLPGALELKGFQANVNQYLWRLTLNGSEVGCFWVQPVNGGVPTGSIGARVLNSEQIYVAGLPYGIVFWSKTAWLQPGRIAQGVAQVSQAIPDTPNVDLLNLATTVEGNEYRVNPGIGLHQDTVDWGLTVGTDWSSIIRFEEGINVVEASLEPNTEPFATVIQSPAKPSLGGSGWFKIPTVAALKKFGPRTVSTGAARVVDTLVHRLYNQRLAALSSTPGHAKRFTVKRDEWADLVRELDWVEVHCPKLDKNLSHQRSKVLGYIFREDLGTTEFLLDQYPRTLDRVPALDRLMATVESLASRTDEVTATDPTKPGLMVRSPQISIPINPYKFRVLMSANQNVSTGVFTTVNFDTVVFDTSNSFNPSNHQFTAPITGWYFFFSTVDATLGTDTVDNQVILVSYWVNGIKQSQGTYVPMLQASAGAGILEMGGVDADLLLLNAGDTVVVQANVVAITPTLQASRSYWTGHLVSA